MKRAAFPGTGTRMAKIRQTMNYTGRQMAAWLNLKMSTYYKNESGDNIPGWVTLNKLHKEADISVDWFIFNRGPMYNREKIPNLSQWQAERKRQEEELSKANEQLQQAREQLKEYTALKKDMPEVDRLLEAMASDPELRHEVLLNFYRYKKAASQPETGK